MFLVIITAVIALLCLIGLIRTASDKNVLGTGFSLVAFLVFTWFTVMETYNWIKELLQTDV